MSPRGTRRARSAARRPALLTAAGLAVLVVIAAAFTFVAHRTGRDPVTVAAPAVTSPAPSVSPTSVTAVTTAPHASASSKAPPSEKATASRRVSTSTTGKTGHRQVTFVNAERQTIWVAAAEQTAKPALPVTGWVLQAGRSLTIDVPDHWNGRFWGRTGCSFTSAGTGHCATGDCSGRFQCRQYGAVPAGLAEFNFNSYLNLDFYDVSLVDGSNVPMWINIAAGKTKDPISSRGCSSAGCTKAVPCPSELKVGGGGCESPCGVFDTDQYCCRGKWAPRDQCKPEQWPVDYAAIFKQAQPFAYSYVDDDATSTFTCAGECGYRITWGTSAQESPSLPK